MDPWKCVSEGRNNVWLSDVLDDQFDGQGRSKSRVMGCEYKSLCSVENYPMVPNSQALERWDFMDLGFSDEIRKSYSVSSDPSGEALSDDIGNASYGNGVSPFVEERQSFAKVSTDFTQSVDKGVSLIDLKLGCVTDDGGGAMGGNCSGTGVSVPSNMSGLPAKRSRSTLLYPRSPCCQVFGCNKDLSSFKGYYKRHKVCDVHTKTAKVIVDGVAQRFCQQCSRFHLLCEFDDGKRSCRRRLNAHNKRRRKPNLIPKSGTETIGFSSSFSISEVLPTFIMGSGEDFEDTILGTARPTAHSSSGIQQISGALSLLSAQSDTMPSHFTGAATTTTLLNKSSHADSSSVSHSAGIFNNQSGLHAPAVNPMGTDTVSPSMISINNGSMVDLVAGGPDLRNNGYHQTLKRDVILDLLQLSSHLQRVEQQRHSTESGA